MKAKIFGAGSIGNHLAQAARRVGWDVMVVDPDREALRRMKEDIYPARYGKWDDAISQFVLGKEPKGDFDAIFIGTPPDVRMQVTLQVLEEEKPKVLLLEKPLCPPNDKNLIKVVKLAKEKGVAVVVGYDHAVSPSVMFVSKTLRENTVGNILTLDVEFREHWGGIFEAHPWLSGPEDTYLGFTNRGGGASGEHSHALHLWLTFAKAAGIGEVNKVAGVYHQVTDKKVSYDDLAAFTLETKSGVFGRVIQDVITRPTRKWAHIQGKDGSIEWQCGIGPGGADVVKINVDGKDPEEKIFEKIRPDDFYAEILHIDKIIKGEISSVDSPISFESGINVMRILSTVDSSYPNSIFLPLRSL